MNQYIKNLFYFNFLLGPNIFERGVIHNKPPISNYSTNVLLIKQCINDHYHTTTYSMNTLIINMS